MHINRLDGLPRPLAPSRDTSNRRAAVVEVGILRLVHPAGYGFAQSLTSGSSSGDIFLNEDRVAALSASGADVVGILVRMAVVDKPDGKRAAIHAQALDFRDLLAAEQLWGRVSHTCGDAVDVLRLQTLFPDQPVILPLVIALLDNKFEHGALLRAIIQQLPNDWWAEPVLKQALNLAPKAVRGNILQHYLALDSDLVADLLFGWVRDRSYTPHPFWLGSLLSPLWERLSERRPDILNLALTALQVPSSSYASADSELVARALDGTEERLTWAKRGIDHSTDNRQPWWDVIIGCASDDLLPIPDSCDHWLTILQAPQAVIRALARRRCPTSYTAIVTLKSITSWTVQHAIFDAEEVFDALDEGDKVLAERWMKSVRKSNMTESNHDRMDNAIRAQMQTARAAEKCAMRYLQSIGLDVRDVAINQLSNHEEDWKVMDLRINDQDGVDVKNCRRTINGGLRSGRWKVKAFKDDAAGSQVVLCGVSSPHTTLDHAGLKIFQSKPNYSGHPLTVDISNSVVVLGVTRAAEVQRLMHRFCDISDIHMPSREKITEMPAWAWDYPEAHYKPRNEALQALRQVMIASEPTRLESRLHSELPPILLSFMDLDQPEDAVLDEQQQEFLEELRVHWRITRDNKLSRFLVPRLPWLYLFILHFWVRYRLTGKPSHAKSLTATFRQGLSHLRVDDIERSGSSALAPMVGIADTATTIDELLMTLAILDENLPPEKFVRMSKFTLYPNGVFTASFPDGVKRTLLAHCGGKLSSKMIDCGHWPLVYGKYESCTCGRLICTKCKSCSDSGPNACPHQLERQGKNRDHSEGFVSSPTQQYGWIPQ